MTLVANRAQYLSYPAYKPSGVKWLGEIPEGWGLTPLKYLCKFNGGGTPSKENPSYWKDGTIPWVSPKDMGTDSISNTQDKVTAAAVEASSTNYIEIGALLMVVRSGILRHTIPTTINVVQVTLNQDMKALRFSEKMVVRYAQYYTKGNQAPLLLEWLKEGATVESIEQAYLSNSQFLLPPITEQTKIVAFLDYETAKIDGLLAKQQRLINLLEEKRQAVISHTVAKGLNPNAPQRPSGINWLGTVPTHWCSSYLGFESTIKARLGWKGLKADEYVDDGYIFLATPNIKGEAIDMYNVNYITKKRYDESPEIALKVGDVLVTKDGSTTGTTNVVRELPRPATVNSSIAVIRSGSSVDSEYLYYFFKSSYTQNVIKRMQDGMGVPHLFQADLKKFKLLLPPMQEQKLIVKFLKESIPKLDSLIAKARSAVTLLKERRTALVSATVTGKIDVRNWQPPSGISVEDIKQDVLA